MKKAIFFVLFFISLIVLIVKLASVPVSEYLGFEEKAGVRILSVPDGAAVFINGNQVGQTSFEERNLTDEEISIKLTKDEASWEGKVKLKTGTLTIINRELNKDPTSSAGEILSLEKGSGVAIISSPSDSEVEIDSKIYGKTPLLAQIAKGEHTFVLSHGSYLKRSIRALIPEGYKLTLNVDLALSEADLTSISTPPITETQKVVVKNTPTGFLRVRDKASLSGKEVARVLPGDELILLEELSSWYRVRLPDGKEGYVSASYVEKAR